MRPFHHLDGRSRYSQSHARSRKAIAPKPTKRLEDAFRMARVNSHVVISY
jgi:hypothetical protein